MQHFENHLVPRPYLPSQAIGEVDVAFLSGLAQGMPSRQRRQHGAHRHRLNHRFGATRMVAVFVADDERVERLHTMSAQVRCNDTWSS